MSDDLSAFVQEASFEGIRFPVSRITTSGGHDLAEHTAYRRDGADVEACGRRAYQGSFDIPLVNAPDLVARYGTLYPDLLTTLVALFEGVPLGRFVHPTTGAMTIGLKRWEREDSPVMRNGVMLVVDYVEHSATAQLALADGTVPTDPTTGAVTRAVAADAACVAAGSGSTPMTSVVTTQVAFLGAGARSYPEVLGALRAMLDLVTTNVAWLARLTPTALTMFDVHAAAVALEALRASLYALRDAYLPRPEAVRYYTTPRVMAAWEVAQNVYNDMSKAGVIRAANSIADFSAIPAGRVLTILPID